MKKLLTNAAILAVALCSWAVAQTINSSVQMSQDPRGPIAMDTNQGVYLPQHLLNAGKAPTVTGTGSPTLAGTDTMATITMGSAATTATVLFAKAYNTVPTCVVTPSSGLGTVSPLSWTMATTSLAITQGSTSGNLLTYICMSIS